jgi:hypothetical protein
MLNGMSSDESDDDFEDSSEDNFAALPVFAEIEIESFNAPRISPN